MKRRAFSTEYSICTVLASSEAPGTQILTLFALSLPALLIFEGLATLVQDGAYPEIQVVVESLGSLITNRNITKNPVPGSRETKSNGLADVNSTTRKDIDLGVELLDHEGLALSRNRWGKKGITEEE